jgi:multidrug efflux system outer membrane protein
MSKTAFQAFNILLSRRSRGDRALASARRAADLAEQRYKSGIVSYLEVVDANREALQAERASALLAGERNIAAVQLIKALGGGWDEQALFAKADRQQSNAAKQN